MFAVAKKLALKLALVALSALVATGCASNVSIEQDAAEAAKTALDAISLPEISTGPPPIRGTPTEVYRRIAHGAVTCWFGAHGPLRKTHVYHAVAKPPSKGGQARILIHKRDNSLRDKRGARAFAIDVVPAGQTATLEIQNALMGEPRGTEMANDARRWAARLEGCSPEPVGAGWDANSKTKNASKKKVKSAKKAKP